MTTRRHLKRIIKARKKFAKRIHRMVRGQERRAEFLQRNDERVRKIRRAEDRRLENHRERVDRTIAARRERIEKKYVRGDAGKKEKLMQAESRTDERIRAYRNRQDDRIRNYRMRRSNRRIRLLKRAGRFYSVIQGAIIRRLTDIEADAANLLQKKQIRLGILFIALIAAIVTSLMFSLRRKVEEEPEIVDRIPLMAFFEQFEVKEYDTLDMTEEEYLWQVLNEHYDGNETAVLGVMCNLKAESEFRAANLENYNNQIWDVDDDTYLEEINGRFISRDDFLESRYQEFTNGYRNDEHNWVNLDGGYGYAQYTAYDKKEMLYNYAEDWFARGGPGEKYRFNIADPKMQANFVVYLLESEKYKKMDEKISNAPTIVDACYIWLKKYEIPKDPYKDNYYTLSFKRAAVAEEIRDFCTKGGSQNINNPEENEPEASSGKESTKNE